MIMNWRKYNTLDPILNDPAITVHQFNRRSGWAVGEELFPFSRVQSCYE